MRVTAYRLKGEQKPGLAIRRGIDLIAIPVKNESTNFDLKSVLEAGPEGFEHLQRRSRYGTLLAPEEIDFLPPVQNPSKIICVGLNYADHVKESPFGRPTYPTVFPRYASSLVGHGQPIVRPLCSEQLDFEGELVAIIGRRGRHIPLDDALDWVAGYSVFNEASIRDYQFKTSQWAIGKTFDGTGGFGPEFVSADELPSGAKSLRLQTRLNGEVMQSASTSDLLFDVAQIVSILSEVFTFEPGDLIATGTPDGVGLFRKPPRFMTEGDDIEVSIEGIGLLLNPVKTEVRLS